MNPVQELNEKLAALRQPAAKYSYDTRGPDHLRSFRAECHVNSRRYQGDWLDTKKDASRSCAKKILADLGRGLLVPARGKPTYSGPEVDDDEDDYSDLEDLGGDEGEGTDRADELRSSRVDDLVFRSRKIAIVDYENMPNVFDEVDLEATFDRIYLVISASHHKTDALVASPPTSSTIIVVQPSSLRDASDTMIVLLVGRLLGGDLAAGGPTGNDRVVIFTRDKFASVVMAVVNGEPYIAEGDNHSPIFGCHRVDVVSTLTQLKRLRL